MADDEPEPAMEEEPDVPRWACTACSFSNFGALNECEMCETPRPVEGWYDAAMEGELPNAQIVDEVRQITECDAETAVRPPTPSPPLPRATSLPYRSTPPHPFPRRAVPHHLQPLRSVSRLSPPSILLSAGGRDASPDQARKA